MPRDNKNKENLEPGILDYAHKGVKTGIAISPLPFSGGIAEVFATVFGPPIEKRRDALLKEVYSDIKELETKVEGLKFENLATNEVFLSTLLHASQVAMRTNERIKIEALRNALINTALIPTMDENLRIIFLNLIDRYSPWHLMLLQFFADPKQYFIDRVIPLPQISMGDMSSIIKPAFYEVKGIEKLYAQIGKEMISDGLLTEGEYLRGGMSESGLFAPRITELGKQFLAFITTTNE
jgi:hypothetical protein